MWAKELESRKQISSERRKVQKMRKEGRFERVCRSKPEYWTHDTYESAQSTEGKQTEWPKIQFISAIQNKQR